MFRGISASTARTCALKRSIHAYYSRNYATEQGGRYEPKKGDQVVVGMSGGVDSSVAALLLTREDYDLSAVFMRNWDTRDESGTDKGCEWEKDWEDVQRVCRKLDIPVSMIDLSKEYWNRVFEPSLRQWELGISPNTDVWCNKEIKFGALLERLPSSYGVPPWFATDRHKDQTYYLSSISESGLRRALFPLNGLPKPEVRELARKHDLHNADRPDSVGICFVGEKAKFRNFLSGYIPSNSGPIIDQVTGKVLGQHDGLWNYTIGERSRLAGMPVRMSVSRKDLETNTVYVVPGTKHENLFTDVIHVPEFSWIWKDAIPQDLHSPTGFRAQVMHRYRMTPVPCTVKSTTSGGLVIECDEPEHAVAPGQVAVLYDGDWCLGCGPISQTTRSIIATASRELDQAAPSSHKSEAEA
ncbi:hypothetical protein H1R20_g6394, partial [Candolleomyces eurysporus]